jgi:hypothetical protein
MKANKILDAIVIVIIVVFVFPLAMQFVNSMNTQGWNETVIVAFKILLPIFVLIAIGIGLALKLR